MDCKHEINMLMGTADGIVCRNCGRLFRSFEEIKGPVEKPAEAPENAKKGRKKKND